MMKYLLRISFRNLVKSWETSLINIFGLSLGLSCFIIIFIHIDKELSYDKFHKNHANIFRLNLHEKFENGENVIAITPGAWASEIKENFPNIEGAARIYKCRVDPIVGDSHRKFYEGNFIWADPEILSIFTFSLQGNQDPTVLVPRNSLVISERMAKKYFGNEDPIGKILKYEDTDVEADLIVTGIFKEPPSNVHFKPEFIANLASLEGKLMHGDSDLLSSMELPFFHTYFLVSDNTGVRVLNNNINRFISGRISKGLEYETSLQTISDIHFQEGIKWELEPSGNLTSIYLFTSIAILILCVACINFMSLASAEAERKIKNISIRKILGTTKFNLMVSSWTESMILSFVSILLSILLIEVSLPAINNFLQVDYSLIYFREGSHLPYLVAVTLIVGFIAGSYPAFSLSKSSPLNALKGKSTVSKKSVTLRQALVIFQFSISIFLVVNTAFITNQMDFIQNKNVGFSREAVLNIPTRGEEAGSNYDVYKDLIVNNSAIINVTGSFHQPFNKVWDNLRFKIPSIQANNTFLCNQFNASEGFIETFQIEVLAGRSFLTSDTGSFLLNESAVRSLGLSNESVIGMEIEDIDIFQSPGRVIGVVKDFHYKSLHNKIEPLAIWHTPYWPNFMSIKIRVDNISETISYLAKSWEQVNPNTPFSFTFLDNDLENLYRSEQKMKSVFRVFSIVAIFIACLGLFGLSKLSINKRNKEIGIRKILGADLWVLMLLINKEYFVLILLAFLMSFPVTYFLVYKWLETFAYRTEIHMSVFFLAAIGLALICFITISYHVIKAVYRNPVQTIRYE